MTTWLEFGLELGLGLLGLGLLGLGLGLGLANLVRTAQGLRAHRGELLAQLRRHL